MAEEDMERKRDAALRLMGQPQTQQTQDQMRQQQQQVRDLSQMRPVVQQAVIQQEQRATQVLAATFDLFRDRIERSGDPELRKAFRESSLNTMLGG